ncbi:transglutaminase family protein [Streptomyces bacillaris]|uniref:Transglutaminase family protein n=1 Tax=Streptomyces cavourensis TaxID=67258 RepID=A0ABY5F9H3_9ACTN|nr:transglutaminase family protein [Streptomyces cavourensis]TQO28648.1 transglutaminase superfamily protein [Streptomyces cavourensis]UTR80373.1 transglutaminase family protein [Streptomyces cavourensis]GGU89518.1 transglutaminase [Streptomyces cavourensis]
MELIQQTPDIAAYLAADEAIDHDHPQVRGVAAELASRADDAYTYARAAFAYVRDTIPHSADSGDPRVTWRASDVLATRTGICYAKSIALTALLRAHAVPAGLCYQRLTDDGTNPVVHGLVALRLPGHDRWARVDPRGNKPGVDARFSLDTERLAWTVREELGETDYPALHATPPAAVLHALRSARDRTELWRMLPTQL